MHAHALRVALAAVVLSVPAAAAADPGARIDAVMKEWARPDAPGCAVAAVRDGKVVHAKGYGMADLERAVPIGPETAFDIASTSKQFTAAAILLLAAEGKLALDDDIRKHLPELPALSKRPVTIRHLLHHTGGLRDYMALLRLGGKTTADVATAKQTLAALARQRGADFEPGTKHEYSNTGYFLLAQIAERAGKQPLAKLVEARIFKPLGMARSMILDDHRRLVPHRALAYAPASGGGWELAMSRWEQTGDGAVQTTVLDLAKWDANFYDPKVGGRALLDALHTRGTLDDGKVLDYAAGLMHGTYRGQPIVEHAGGWAGYRAQLTRFPQLKASVIVLCNAATAGPTTLARKLADALLDKELAAAPAPSGPRAAPTPAAPAPRLSAAELDAWVGTYRDAKTGAVISVSRRGDQLALKAGEDGYPLTLLTRQTARLPGGGDAVELSGTAPTRKLVARDRSGAVEEYVELAPYTPSPAELASLARPFTSDEAGVTWVISLVQNKLIVRGPGLDGAALVPTTKDELALPGAGLTLKLIRQRGALTGFSAGSGALWLRFDRI